MVAKMSGGNAASGALHYNQKKLDAGKARVLLTNRMLYPQDGRHTVESCMRSFRPYLDANRRTERPMVHISLNPDPTDRLDDNKLTEIARAYMQRMGYGEQPYIVYKHTDLEREHLHIVTLCVDENGKRLSNAYEHRRSARVCRQIEQEYALVSAARKKTKKISEIRPVSYAEGDIRAQMSHVIRMIATEYRFLTMTEYRALLSIYNIGVSDVQGKRGCNKYNGLLYHVLDENGRKKGEPIKSFVFGRHAGIPALEKRMTGSMEEVRQKRLKTHTRQTLERILGRQPLNTERFREKLRQEGISVILRYTDGGRLYGVTFVDHRNKAVFNGSRLGKAYSAAALESVLNPDSCHTVLLPSQDSCRMQYTPVSRDESLLSTDDKVIQWETGSLLPRMTTETGMDESQEAAFRKQFRHKPTVKRRPGR